MADLNHNHSDDSTPSLFSAIWNELFNSSNTDELIVEFENAIVNNDHEHSISNTNSILNGLGTSLPETSINASGSETLEIIAQPTSIYRPRYVSELNRANRFIRTAKENQQYEYPTIKIPFWCQQTQQLYIRITLVTIISDRVLEHCIHPYDFITSDEHAIKDQTNNSLYFLINENEYKTRTKSVRLMILRKKQEELQSSEPMRLYDSGQNENIIIKTFSEPKEKKRLYQFSKSQFIFTIAQRQQNTNNFILFHNTSIVSEIMTEDINPSTNLSKNHSNNPLIDQIRCIPQTGSWKGGEDIVIFLPNPINRKKYQIIFDFDKFGKRDTTIEFMDTRTILCRTPACPFIAKNEYRKVLITIHEDHTLLSTIDFYYTPAVKTTTNKRWLGQTDGINNKRLRDSIEEEEEADSGEIFTSHMAKLSIEKRDTRSRSHSIESEAMRFIHEKLMNLDKRLGQIKLGLENFVRTNNPSELFRATGFLLSKYSGNSSSLHDAIENGHIKIALVVIEQTIHLSASKNLLETENENGETPLLLAAKFNHWKIIEFILQHRSDLVIKQKDNHGNNIFHLLANLNEDKGVETIEKIFEILSEKLKITLLNEENKQNQTPINIAQIYNNTSTLELFNNNKQ